VNAFFCYQLILIVLDKGLLKYRHAVKQKPNKLGIERVQACTRWHFAFALQHPAVWTKWNGARSRRVDVIAGEGVSLRRHV